ncbi:MAG TPA: hypothetical protein VKI44_18070 [Acetobacteraceae bacterium]|nr:hypothetical protein [Acetobacteraceae bacterium]
MLQQLDMSTERRLGHIQSQGGSAKMEILGHGQKAAQLIELEHRCAIRIG